MEPQIRKPLYPSYDFQVIKQILPTIDILVKVVLKPIRVSGALGILENMVFIIGIVSMG